MPPLVAALVGGLVQAGFSIVGRVLISLGFAYVTMTGIDTSLQWIQGQIAASMAGLPAQVVGVLSACRVGTALAIVLSALAARLLFDGMTAAAGGSIKKLRIK